MLGRKRGQSTLEYVLILTAIIAVVFVISQGILKSKVQSSLEHVINESYAAVQRVNLSGGCTTGP